MEAVVHARCQPQRDIEAIAMPLDEKRRAKKIGQTVGKALDLKELSPGNPPVGTDDGVAWTHDDLRIAVDRPRAVPELAREAIVQARKLRLPRVREIDVAKQPPQRDREIAHERLLDLAEPAHETREQAARDTVGQKKVDVLLQKHFCQSGAHCHETVAPR